MQKIPQSSVHLFFNVVQDSSLSGTLASTLKHIADFSMYNLGPGRQMLHVCYQVVPARNRDLAKEAYTCSCHAESYFSHVLKSLEVSRDCPQFNGTKISDLKSSRICLAAGAPAIASDSQAIERAEGETRALLKASTNTADITHLNVKKFQVSPHSEHFFVSI